MIIMILEEIRATVGVSCGNTVVRTVAESKRTESGQTITLQFNRSCHLDYNKIFVMIREWKIQKYSSIYCKLS